jgi:hypothetical protein
VRDGRQEDVVVKSGEGEMSRQKDEKSERMWVTSLRGSPKTDGQVGQTSFVF